MWKGNVDSPRQITPDGRQNPIAFSGTSRDRYVPMGPKVLEALG
jgi:hypothetical protein